MDSVRCYEICIVQCGNLFYIHILVAMSHQWQWKYYCRRWRSATIVITAPPSLLSLLYHCPLKSPSTNMWPSYCPCQCRLFTCHFDALLWLDFRSLLHSNLAFCSIYSDIILSYYLRTCIYKYFKAQVHWSVIVVLPRANDSSSA